jgi:two-component system, NarL family, response regulator NreC
MRDIDLLIVDDHHLMIEGYKSILASTTGKYRFSICTAADCQSAYKLLTGPDRKQYDLVFLDRGLPPYEQQRLYNGDDLAKLARKCLPNAKVVILTSHAEAFVLYNIVKAARPEGLLVKSDFNADEFVKALTTILDGGSYHSATVTQNIKDISSRESYLDNYNRQIISLLAKGIKTKSMPEYIPLSISSIDKRKAQIKEFFEIEKGGDEDILREAKRAGFI